MKLDENLGERRVNLLATGGVHFVVNRELNDHAPIAQDYGRVGATARACDRYLMGSSDLP